MNLRQPHPNRLNYVRFPRLPKMNLNFPVKLFTLFTLIDSNQFQFVIPNNCQALAVYSLADANAAKLERWAKVSKNMATTELSIHPSAGGGIRSGKRDAAIAISNASSRSCRHMNHCSLRALFDSCVCQTSPLRRNVYRRNNIPRHPSVKPNQRKFMGKFTHDRI